MNGIWEQIYSSGSQLNRYPYDSLVSFVFRHAPSGIPRRDVRILEVGSGAGNNLWFLSREGFDVSGLEYSASAVAFAKERMEKEGLSADVRQGDFRYLPYEDCTFDMALDRGALTCVDVEDMKHAVDEIRRVLKVGGVFFFNPYSDRHSSFTFSLASTQYIEPTAGSLAAHGGISFLSRCDLLKLLDRFRVESIRHCEEEECIGEERIRNAWWIAIARKDDE